MLASDQSIEKLIISDTYEELCCQNILLKCRCVLWSKFEFESLSTVSLGEWSVRRRRHRTRLRRRQRRHRQDPETLSARGSGVLIQELGRRQGHQPALLVGPVIYNSFQCNAHKLLFWLFLEEFSSFL